MEIWILFLSINRKTVDEQIYNPINELKEFAANCSKHFELYKKGKGNISVCIKFLLKINEEWFSTTENKEENNCSINVYAKCFDEIYSEIEKFRCKIYKQKYVQIKPSCIISRMKDIKHEEKCDENNMQDTSIVK